MVRGRERAGFFIVLSCLIGAAAFAGEPAQGEAENTGPDAPVQAAAETAPEPEQPAYGESLEPQRIIVTATRIPTAENKIGDSITVFTPGQIEERQYRNVSEVLRNVPGLHINRTGGEGSLTEVRIRGLDNGRTVMMMDGMPLNDPSTTDRAFDFSSLTLDNLGQLEVLRGPQSTLYGSNASGGIINLTSKKGEGPFSGYLSTEGGSRGTVITRLGSSAGTDKVDYSFAGSILHTDGFSAYDKKYGFTEKDGDDRGAFSLRLGANPSDILRLDLFANAFAAKNEIDYTSMDASWNTVYYEDGVVVKTERYMVRPQVTLSLFDGRWEQKVGYGYVTTRRRQELPEPGAMHRNKYVGETYKFDYQSILRLHETNTILAGVDVVSETMSYLDPYYGPVVPPAVLNDIDLNKTTTVGVYLEDQVNLNDVFFATLGVRQEHHDDYGDKTTWKASAAYALPTGTRLKASAGTGFNAPSLYYLHVPTNWNGTITNPNPNLKPETSFGWDAGFEQSILGDRLLFGATYFENKVKNKIGPDATWTTWENIGKYRSWGIEAFVQFAVTDNLTISGEYTWLRAEDENNKGNLGIQSRRPLNEFAVNVDWRFLGKGTFTAGVNYTGRRWDTVNFPPYGTARMPSYAVARAGAAWKFTKNIEVFGRVENLLNKKYEEINGFGTERIGFFAGATVSF